MDGKSCQSCIHAYTTKVVFVNGKKEPEIMCTALKAAMNFVRDFNETYEFVKMIDLKDIANNCSNYLSLTEAQEEFKKARDMQKRKHLEND